MSISDQRTQLKLVTVGDLDPQADGAIEYDFIGRVIAGRYTVRKHIGGGGMADVFRATDEELDIDIAIKLLKPRMASDELRARMVQEARAAAQVRHANLVRVFGTGKLDATAYIAMELLAGPNLEQYVREYRGQRIPWQEALDLLLPALEALHAVHERGYIHRDIKPGNILVTREPGCPPQAIVIDLGLVKPDRALRNAASPPTTEVGRMLCTPGYTSPEQAAGNPVDRRSDVYSMAITLYRVLAGRLPFHEARGQPMLAVLAKHIYNQPTMLAVAAPDAAIPPAIASVIESALAKSPNDRPRTMQAFADALREAALESAVALSPARRPHWLLLTSALGVTLTWLVTAAIPVAPSVDPAVSVLQVDPEVVPTPPPSHRFLAEEDRRSLATTSTPPIALPQPGPRPASSADETEAIAHETTAARRVLATRVGVVQRCVDQTIGEFPRLLVAMKISTAGRVSAHVHRAADSPLSRCIDEALKNTPIAPPMKPLTFVQVFDLRATPQRP